ncbi:MAG: nitroreductase family protein [Bacillota bacterium]
MNVLDAIRERRSIRRYSPRMVEDEKLEKVLEAARLAPSANNRQSWKFVVVKDRETRQKLAEAAGAQAFVGQAPVVIVGCGTDPDSVMKCGQHRYTVDLSIATAYMILEACELGLGTCWIGHFDENTVKDILGVPANVRVVTMMPIGYPDEAPSPRPRKKLEEIVCYERYE